ncbi:hypothetical protein SD70_00465 [Gordoniibacillus kamchatkensis]|uniref:DUF2225 domain-containing protein n=1 Tax=Gordoniibacillus kamchatkensis TaxID=1590651 RepID=A0ABR5AND9_9BACL|nr:DUF2225 domain-containing protein [Paenibacillus sp. VKM B-2647]KIL42539.1 hypothetical protein SD70_00465 [Paenibacillus sp. VKM B-2647]
MAVEPLYKTTVTCPNCDNKFSTSRVRPSFKKAVKTDSDFCTHYKEHNPDYYVVRVCPYCGYASTENFAKQITNRQKEAFKNKISNYWQVQDYGGERDWQKAMTTYKLALLTGQTVGEKDRVIAGLLHHIAWLYRLQEDQANEQRFLGYALEAYISVYEKEGLDLNNARLMFLIGDLNRRLKNYFEAVKWFSRIVNDKKIMDAAMIRASREMWTATREDMQAEKLEIPPESQIK